MTTSAQFWEYSMGSPYFRVTIDGESFTLSIGALEKLQHQLNAAYTQHEELLEKRNHN